MQAQDFHHLYAHDLALTTANEAAQDVTTLEPLYREIISAAHGSDNAKLLAATLVPKHLHLFPSLAEKALNAHIDLCEVMEKKIRLQAISQLHVISRYTPTLTSRIADILIQMLVTDDVQEKQHVHQGLRLVFTHNPKGGLDALFGHVGRGQAHPLYTKALQFLQQKILTGDVIGPQPSEDVLDHIVSHFEQLLPVFAAEQVPATFKELATLCCGVSYATAQQPQQPPQQQQKQQQQTATQTQATSQQPKQSQKQQQPQTQQKQLQQQQQQQPKKTTTDSAAPSSAPSVAFSSFRVARATKLLNILNAWVSQEISATNVSRLVTAIKLSSPLLKIDGACGKNLLTVLYSTATANLEQLQPNDRVSVVRLLALTLPHTTFDLARSALPNVFNLLLKVVPEAKSTTPLAVELTEAAVYVLHGCGTKARGQLNRTTGIKLSSAVINDGSLEDHSETRTKTNVMLSALVAHSNRMFEAAKEVVTATTPPCPLTEKKHFAAKATMVAAFNTKLIAMRLMKAKGDLESISDVKLSFASNSPAKTNTKKAVPKRGGAANANANANTTKAQQGAQNNTNKRKSDAPASTAKPKPAAQNGLDQAKRQKTANTSGNAKSQQQPRGGQVKAQNGGRGRGAGRARGRATGSQTRGRGRNIQGRR